MKLASGLSVVLALLSARAASAQYARKASLHEGRLGSSEEGVEIVSAAFSPDGLSAAYVAKKGAKEFVVWRGKKGEEFDAVSPPVWSGDAESLGYIVREGGKDFVVVDGQKGQAFDEVKKLVFSPLGKAFAYAAREGDREFVVLGAQKGTEFDAVRDPVLAPDGGIVAYAARKGGKWSVVAGGQKGEDFDQVGDPVFSPGGARVAYGAVQGRSLLWKVREAPRSSRTEKEALETARGHLLAMRSVLSIFHGDHNGRYPNAVDELVPKYLLAPFRLELPGHSAEDEAVVIADAKGNDLAPYIKDTGRWLYVSSPGSPLDGTLAIDCSHKDSKGTPLYRW